MAERVLLRVKDLKKTFESGHVLRKKEVFAVRGVSFEISRGQTFGLVGESGSGKSTVGRLVARLLDRTSGTVEFDGLDIGELSGADLRRARRDIQVIFQDPLRSLDPRMTVRQILDEPYRLHRIGSKAERRDQIHRSLEAVGMSDAALSRYPHEFSGGQRQRIAIARALALRPKLIIADEPTSSLDVSVQAQVLNLMRDLQDEFGVAYLFISHDLHVVQYMSNVTGVMYLGSLVEVGRSDLVFEQPLHPYTQSLLAANPSISDIEHEYTPLKGEVPSPTELAPGCAFSTRCPKAMEHCSTVAPPVVTDASGRFVRCHLYGSVSVGISASNVPADSES
jgi:oligopeptide transport system ATP-binding protein